nr:uncharacterized protein LOC113814619 [Penaeus vannamei]
MRQYRAQAVLAVVLAVAWSASGKPLPVSEPEENALNEVSEDSLLVLVPTLPLDDHERSGQDLKREVEYEVISIPGDLLRREIRQVAQQYGPPSLSFGDNNNNNNGGGFVVQADTIQDFGEVINPAPTNSYDTPSSSQSTSGFTFSGPPSSPSPTLPPKQPVTLPPCPEAGLHPAHPAPEAEPERLAGRGHEFRRTDPGQRVQRRRPGREVAGEHQVERHPDRDQGSQRRPAVRGPA